MGSKKVQILLVCFGLATLPGWAQKVRYKDLIQLLNSNQFDQAEPHLRRYVKENDDNPSAHLYMGIILQNKALAVDMLKDTDPALAYMDSAATYLKKALEGITEREVSRNEENYMRYRSRDIRTGEFEIKFAEVRFKVEQDVKNLTLRRDLIRQLRSRFDAFRLHYEGAKRRFLNLVAANPTEKELYLRSDETTAASLAEIHAQFDSAMWSFDAYQAASQQVGKTGYKHVLDRKEIVKYGEDGKRDFAFYNDDLKVWDFGSWAGRSAKFIKEEVYPLREKLLALDRELVKLRQTMEKDSVSVLKALSLLYPRLSDNPVQQYDANPMPLKVFRMTYAELSFYSKWLENKTDRRSGDLLKKKSAFQSELPYLKKLDSISGLLLALDIEHEAANYQGYVRSTYGSTGVLKNLITSTNEFAKREVQRCETAIGKITNQMRWLVVAADSIPLAFPVRAENPIQPLVVAEERFTQGIRYPAEGPASGYFYTITPTRLPDVQVAYGLDTAFTNRKNLAFFRGLATSDEQGQVFFTAVFSERRNSQGRFPVTICKIYRTDGLAWQTNYQFENTPVDLQFNAASGELLVRVSVAGESKILVLDKTGKLLP